MHHESLIKRRLVLLRKKTEAIRETRAALTRNIQSGEYNKVAE